MTLAELVARLTSHPFYQTGMASEVHVDLSAHGQIPWTLKEVRFSTKEIDGEDRILLISV